MKYLVEALDTYKKLSIKDKELDRIPEKGEIFEVNEERLEILLGNNKYNTAFVKLVEEETNKEETKTKNTRKKGNKK